MIVNSGAGFTKLSHRKMPARDRMTVNHSSISEDRMSHPHAEHAHHEKHEHHEKGAHHETHEANARAPLPVPEAQAAPDDVHEARGEVKAPEAQVVEHSDAPLVPLEPKPVISTPPQSVAVPVGNDNGAKHPLVVEEDVRARAEGLLAAYIGERIEPALTDGLVLNLKQHLNHEHDGIELCFEGSRLESNSGLLGEEVLKALKEHPVFAPLFANEKTRPHFVKPTEAGKEKMLHVHVNHLTADQYSGIIHALSVPLAQPKHEAVMEKATGTSVEAKKQETANDNGVPSAVLQQPIASLDRVVANDNSLEPKGMTR